MTLRDLGGGSSAAATQQERTARITARARAVADRHGAGLSPLGRDYLAFELMSGAGLFPRPQERFQRLRQGERELIAGKARRLRSEMGGRA